MNLCWKIIWYQSLHIQFYYEFVLISFIDPLNSYWYAWASPQHTCRIHEYCFTLLWICICLPCLKSHVHEHDYQSPWFNIDFINICIYLGYYFASYGLSPAHPYLYLDLLVVLVISFQLICSQHTESCPWPLLPCFRLYVSKYQCYHYLDFEWMPASMIILLRLCT